MLTADTETNEVLPGSRFSLDIDEFMGLIRMIIRNGRLWFIIYGDEK